MSDEAQPGDSPEDALLGLNALDLGPAWARGETEQKKSGEGKRRRGGDQGRNERSRGRGEGNRGEGRREGRGARRDDRRRSGRQEGGGGRERRLKNGGRGRREEDRRGSRDREEVAAPEGFTAEVMPVEEGLDGLAKEILAGGRTYSVFDLAKLVLGARDRFNVTFQSNRDDGGLVRCKKDGSLWLSREEALRHFWSSDWRSDYYAEIVTDAEPPQGNFQAVARCGLSGEWLGPPNYHGYQPAVVQLHRERFGHMSLEAFKKKVRMERGEEAVAAWLEKMSQRTSFRPTGGGAPECVEGDGAGNEKPAGGEREMGAADGTEMPESASHGGVNVGEERGEEEQPVGESECESVTDAEEILAGEETAAENAGDSSGEEQPAPVAEDLADAREVERHFLEHYFEDAFQETSRAWVSGNIRGHQLSPGLLTLLRHTVAEERRYPGKLTPILCRQLSGRHVAVFKWRRKLKAGPSRPHPVPDDIAIADRLLSLLNWVTENSGRKLEHLWKALLPEKVSDQEKTGWYHDLHWLLNQGYVLLMADSTVHRAKSGGAGGQKASAAKVSHKKEKTPAGALASREEKGIELPPAGEVAAPAPTPATGRLPGLYAQNGRKLGRARQVVAELDARGLRPRCDRPVEEEQEGSDDAELPIG